MGIDRIGKGGAPPNTGDVAGVEKATKTDAASEPFAASRTPESAAVGAPDATHATSPLARLRAGEIDVEKYLDLKVEEATKPFVGLHPEDLADMKAMLRDQLASDPFYVEEVRAATGQVPKRPQDE